MFTPLAVVQVDKPLRGAVPNNADDFSTARRPTSVVEDPTMSITRVEIEARLKKEKKKASTSLVPLNQKPPYLDEVAAKPYPPPPWSTKYPNSRSSTTVKAAPGNMLSASSIL